MAARISPSHPAAGHAACDARRLISEITPYLRIAHQVGGRVRLKLADDALRVPALHRGAGERLRQLLGELPGVRGITLNALACSCVVEYDNAVIPDGAWPDLLDGRPTAAAETLLGLLASVVNRTAGSLLPETPCSPTPPPPIPGAGKPSTSLRCLKGEPC